MAPDEYHGRGAIVSTDTIAAVSQSFEISKANRTSYLEHLALKSPLDLRGLCCRVREILDLPEFHFDYENETEWGTSNSGNVEYNVSRPYQEGVLQEWDQTVPSGCNFGLSITFVSDHAHAVDDQCAADRLISVIAHKLANGLGIPIHYHRTWCGPGINISRNVVFAPD